MKKLAKISMLKLMLIICLISSCHSSTKFERYIDKEKRALVKIEKTANECSESEKLIGCWNSNPQKMLESGTTVGEKLLQETKRLIFYKDSSFDEITLINSGFMDGDPIIYRRPFYKVENGQFYTKETSHSNPIDFNGETLVLYGTTCIKGNCNE